MINIASYLPALFDLAQKAGQQILLMYSAPSALPISTKTDSTPLTQADLAAHRILLEGLQQLTPDIPVISEESPPVAYAQRKNWPCFWLVDPLDGTREFIAKTDDFCINIALIEKTRPVFGMIYLPVMQTTYYAIDTHKPIKRLASGEEKVISVRPLPTTHEPYLIASRRHANNVLLQAFFERVGRFNRLSRGSALKFCLIAEGLADVYPRFGATSEWDTAAGQCILEAAGGYVIDTEGKPLRYNMRETFLNPSFLAVGDAPSYWRDCLNNPLSGE